MLQVGISMDTIAHCRSYAQYFSEADSRQRGSIDNNSTHRVVAVLGIVVPVVLQQEPFAAVAVGLLFGGRLADAAVAAGPLHLRQRILECDHLLLAHLARTHGSLVSSMHANSITAHPLHVS